MNSQSIDDAPHAFRHHQLKYPLHKIVAVLDRSDIAGVAAALDEAGFRQDRIEFIIAEEVTGLGEPIGGSGIHRVLTWLELSLGDDLDELELARLELAHGHALIQVLIHGDMEKDRVHAILSRHGGHAMHYFGRWTITPIIGEG
ncbi:MAG: hypothetical protein ACR2OE_17985 [Thermomicrobiales bacterium]